MCLSEIFFSGEWKYEVMKSYKWVDAFGVAKLCVSWQAEVA